MPSLPLKRFIRISLLLLLGPGLASCQQERESRANPDNVDGLRIGTSLPILGAIISELIQDDDSITILLDRQESPHSFQPRPSDVRTLARADLILLGDPDIDGWAASLVDNNSRFLTEFVDEGALLHSSGFRNPHFWMDPLFVEHMLLPLADLFCEIRHTACASYQRNAKEFSRTLLSLDAEISNATASLRNQSVITSHPFFDYFLIRYQINPVATLEPVPGLEPSPARIIEILKTANEFKPFGLIAQVNLPAGSIELVRTETNLPIIYIQSIGAMGQSYGEFIRASAAQLLSLDENAHD